MIFAFYSFYLFKHASVINRLIRGGHGGDPYILESPPNSSVGGADGGDPYIPDTLGGC